MAHGNQDHSRQVAKKRRAAQSSSMARLTMQVTDNVLNEDSEYEELLHGKEYRCSLGAPDWKENGLCFHQQPSTWRRIKSMK